MNEIIQSLEANETNGKENFCYISENMLNAMKELSKREKQDKEDFIKWLEDKIKIYENKIEKCSFMAGMATLPLGLYKEVLDKFRGVIDE